MHINKEKGWCWSKYLQPWTKHSGRSWGQCRGGSGQQQVPRAAAQPHTGVCHMWVSQHTRSHRSVTEHTVTHRMSQHTWSHQSVTAHTGMSQHTRGCHSTHGHPWVSQHTRSHESVTVHTVTQECHSTHGDVTAHMGPWDELPPQLCPCKGPLERKVFSLLYTPTKNVKINSLSENRLIFPAVSLAHTTFFL